MTRRLARWAGAAAALLALGVLCGTTGPAAAGEGSQVDDGTTGDARRLLVFSVPGLTWSDLDRLDLPAIEAFAAGAAVGDLVPRSVVHRSDAGDAYLTISAGTRAAGVEGADGEVLRVVEEPAEGNVGEVFRRRTGLVVTDGSVVLGWPELERRNDSEPFDAELGQLHDSLSIAGVATMVVGNADGTDEIGTEFDLGIQRQVGLGFVDGRGVVENGRLGTDLLAVDPDWPFGLRLEPERVVGAFTEGWDATRADQRLAAMVEASDLARVMRYEPLVTRERYDELRDRALRATDDLFARLIERVDLDEDAVLLLAPYNQNRRIGLTVAALRTPAGSAGYLRTATTQRSGIVSLVDVAPTVLDVFGITAPASMEGRPFEQIASTASLDERIEHLVSVNTASRFREHLLTPTTLVIVLGMALVAAVAAAAVAGGWSDRAFAGIRFASLAILAAFPMSYVARAFPLEDLGLAFYWAFLVGSTILVAAVATVVGARLGGPRIALGTVLSLVLLVLVADVTTGSELSLGSAFGYSPTGNSRLYGISNYSYGQVAAAACILAALISARYPTRRGRWGAIAILGALLVVLGVPVWGSDVGGVLAFTPAIGVFVMVLYGYRIRPRTVVLAGAATAVVLLAFGFLDLSRPPSQRAHLGRLFERIGREGLDPLVSIVERKLLANLQVSIGSAWVLAIPVGLAFWAFLARHRSASMPRIRARVPTLHAGLMAAATAAVLGSVLNDSGAIVGGIVFAVVTASLAFLSAEAAVGGVSPSRPAREEPS